MAIIISKNGKNAVKVEKSSVDKENFLQEYIYENPESIPLYDIKEDIKLLILAREFQTTSGPVDAIGVDRDGEIYIIETKLFKNTDKRMVLAQALDYGAALWKHSGDFGQFLATLDSAVTETFDMSLVSKVRDFFDISEEESAMLLENVRRNLAEGSFRFVILMDKLDTRLKDLIIYVNQNSQFDVYAVEFEYYKHETREIIIPKIFGAEVKKDIGISKGVSVRKTWDEESFMKDAREKLSKEDVQIIETLYAFSKQYADEIRWGTGGTRGSFNPVFAKAVAEDKSLFTVRSNGQLSINFHWLNRSSEIKAIRDALKSALEKDLHLEFPDDWDERFIWYSIEEWKKWADQLMNILKKVLAKYI